MIRSGGVLVKSTQNFTPASWNGIPQLGITQAFRWGSYSEMYRRQMWVGTLVDKRAKATARLPLPVYERNVDGRTKVRDHPYARLLAMPHPTMTTVRLWAWTSSMRGIYGEAFWLKERDRGGRPIWVHPIHPTNIHYRDGVWKIHTPTAEVKVARRDLVHFSTFNPDDLNRGLSPLEQLRDTLENEAGARTANSAFWRNGSRPSVILRHPATLSPEAQARLKGNWEDVHSGAENFAKTAVLEEGMEAQVLSLNPEEMQYIEGRKLNREEVCARYDVPPPVVHILDRATFSNITEQMRSMYRDSMAPELGDLEATLELELRDGRMGDLNRDPDFGDEVYAEFLMDEVLRGAFEARIPAMVAAVNAGLLTPSEGREMENRPFIEGSDQLFINAAVVPIDMAGQGPAMDGIEELDPPDDEPQRQHADDPVVRRHLLGIAARMTALKGDTDDR